MITDRQNSKLTFFIFILVIIGLIVLGYFLIKKPDISEKILDDTETLEIDKTKNIVYYDNIDVISSEAQLEYKDIHINLNSDDARELETKLNSNMNKIRGKYTKLEDKYINIRAGRANPSMLNGIMVEFYGVPTPISSVANITVPEARQLFIKPFDRSTLKNIEHAIQEANLGINPTNNGEMIILTIPALTEATRRDYVKQAKALSEEAKVALRNIRQDANNEIKKAELPEDEEKLQLADIQELINKYNKIVDEKQKEKEAELMQV